MELEELLVKMQSSELYDPMSDELLELQLSYIAKKEFYKIRMHPACFRNRV